jgi:membrane fusion protein, multidrug efflux system
MREAMLDRRRGGGSWGRGAPWAALLAACLVGSGGCNGKSGAGGPPPPPVARVSVVTVAEREQAVPVELRTFGAVEPNLTAAIRSQIGGVLTEVHFKEGNLVHEGDKLFSIDSRPYEATLKLAEANLARDTFQADNAKKEASRQSDLLAKGVAAQGEYDTAKATADALAAAVRADNAAIERANLDIGYCTIKAPFTGRAGVLVIDKGNLVKINDTILVNINQIQPVQVGFSVPQGDLPAVQKALAAHEVVVKAYPRGPDDPPETGRLSFIDNMVDKTTGTILLKATFDNNALRLWPGLYVDVVVTLEQQPHALVIPTAAIQTGQKGAYVYVVKADNTVEDRVIVIDRTLDGDTVVADGLKAGDRVVTDGQLNLKPGATIEIKEAIAPLEAPGKTLKRPQAPAAPAKDEAQAAPRGPAAGGPK